MRKRGKIRIVVGADGPTAVYAAANGRRKGLRSWAYCGFSQAVTLGMLLALFLRVLAYAVRKSR